MRFNVKVEYTQGQQAIVVVKLDNLVKLMLTAKEASGLVKLLNSALTKVLNSALTKVHAHNDENG